MNTESAAAPSSKQHSHSPSISTRATPLQHTSRKASQRDVATPPSGPTAATTGGAVHSGPPRISRATSQHRVTSASPLGSPLPRSVSRASTALAARTGPVSPSPTSRVRGSHDGRSAAVASKSPLSPTVSTPVRNVQTGTGPPGTPSSSLSTTGSRSRGSTFLTSGTSGDSSPHSTPTDASLDERDALLKQLADDTQAALEDLQAVWGERYAALEKTLQESRSQELAGRYVDLQADIAGLKCAIAAEPQPESPYRSSCVAQLDKVSRPLAAKPLEACLSPIDETSLKKTVLQLTTTNRLNVLKILLDSVYPGDISSMMSILESHRKKVFDIVGRLPSRLGARILVQLDLKELINVRMVSRTWNSLVSDLESPYIWHTKVRQLTALDSSPPEPPVDCNLNRKAWYELYKALYHRESNWRTGMAQQVTLMKGHTGFVTALKKFGDLVITGSYDETIRLWSARTGKCLKTLRVAGSIACLDYLPSSQVVACGCHDVGRVYVLSTSTGSLIAKLSGHNKGLKAVAINDKYLVSAGMDKAIVVWGWRDGGRKVVRFGQNTNICIGIALVGHHCVSVQVDGIVRTFDIESRTLIGQFAMRDLLRSNPVFAPWLSTLASGTTTNVVMWFAATEERITLGTRDFLLYFKWIDFTHPPILLSYIPTDAATNDLSVGVSDPSKKRVLTSVRFASRSGAERKIYIGHFDERALVSRPDPGNPTGHSPLTTRLMPIGGAWSALCARLALDSPQMNPMTLACDSERVIVGCTSGIVYTISFVGNEYR